jgi:murein DD-endopeptidase MepM/ murein hydrolase activator NlpD
MLIFSVLLFIEYFYFKRENQKIFGLQKVYHAYIVSLEELSQNYYFSLKKFENFYSENDLPILKEDKDFELYYPLGEGTYWISSYFGNRKNQYNYVKMHTGLDMASLKGTPVKASQGGIVLDVSSHNGYGKNIVIFHNFRYKTRYAHLAKVFVKIGQNVKKGEIIGLVGDTGSVRKIGKDGSHLHFEVLDSGKPVDPLEYLR